MTKSEGLRQCVPQVGLAVTAFHYLAIGAMDTSVLGNLDRDADEAGFMQICMTPPAICVQQYCNAF